MNFEEKTLDLTGFNRANFAGVIRLRQIADWANDYWKNGYKLAKIKLMGDEWRELVREIEQDNRKVWNSPLENMEIDLGFGPIEVINVDKRK